MRQKNFEVLAGIDEMGHQGTAFSEPINYRTIIPVRTETEKNDHVSDLKEEIAGLKELLQSMKQESVQSSLPEEMKPFVDYLKRQDLNDELIADICNELAAYAQTSSKIQKQEMSDIAKKILKVKLQSLLIGGLSFKKKYVCVLGPTGVGKTTTIAKMAARSVLEAKKKSDLLRRTRTGLPQSTN